VASLEFSPGKRLVPAASMSSYRLRIDYEHVPRVVLKAAVAEVGAGVVDRARRAGIESVAECEVLRAQLANFFRGNDVCPPPLAAIVGTGWSWLLGPQGQIFGMFLKYFETPLLDMPFKDTICI